MTHKKLGVLTGLLTMALLLSACDLRYSSPPLATPTLIPTGLFVSPFPSGQDPLKVVADLGTQTALAKATQDAETPGTPVTPGTVTPTVPAGTVITPQNGASLTPTSGISITLVSTTPAPATVVPGSSSVTPSVVVPTVSSTRPTTYTLQEGEFVYCISRRFNLNPNDVLALNNIVDSETVYPGLTLKIPQTGTFPGDRAWHTRPATYTVTGSGDTSIYGVACYYGDIFPETIAKANNLALSATLSIGQKLTIP